MKRYLTALTVIALLLCSCPAWADMTPQLRLKVLDSLAPGGYKYVMLYDYTNPSCEGNRILIQSSDAQYFKEMFAMVLGAFYTGTPVSFQYTVSDGQCRASRVFLYHE